MTEQMQWLLIDVGNTAIKWRLANAEGLLDTGVVKETFLTSPFAPSRLRPRRPQH